VNCELIAQISEPECYRIISGARVPLAKDRIPGLGNESAHSLNISGF